MKNCMGCKWAKWDTTKNGRLHPGGGGNCMKEIKMPKLPQSQLYFLNETPRIIKMMIYRKETFDNDCVYYERG